MPKSNEQRLTLYQLARDHWLEAHRTLFAYERDYRKNRSIGERLRLGTLVCAIITAVSTVPIISAVLPHLTTVAGVLTAVLSAIESAYAPAKASQAFWDCRTQLEAIKKDIVTFVIGMSAATDVTPGIEALQQINVRLTDVAKTPFEPLPSDQEEAQRAFKGSVLAGIIDRHEIEPEVDEAVPAALGFDAPDIVAVSRKLSHASRG
jgi:hypothetical protein